MKFKQALALLLVYIAMIGSYATWDHWPNTKPVISPDPIVLSDFINMKQKLRNGRSIPWHLKRSVREETENSAIQLSSTGSSSIPVVGSTGTFSGTVTATAFNVSPSTGRYGFSGGVDGISYEAGTASLLFYASNAEQWRVSGASGNLISNVGRSVDTGGKFNSSVANGGDGVSFTNEAEIQWPDTKIAEVGTTLAVTASGGTTFSAGASVPQGFRLGYNGNTSGFVYDGTNVLSEKPMQVGVGATIGQVSSTLNCNTTGVGNVGASGPDDLQVYQLPANSLVTTGRCVRVVAMGTQAANTNAKTVRLTIGPTPTAIITKQLQQATSTASTWKIEATICRTSASNQDFIAEAFNYGGVALGLTEGPTIVDLGATGTLTQTETNALDIKTQSTVSTSNNDIVSEMLCVYAI